MPDLPTLTVTAAQAQTLLAAFGDSIDPVTGQPLTPTVAYKRWLRDSLVQHVVAAKQIELDRAARDANQATLAAFSDGMPGMPS
jgi:hypothetical protein